MQGEVQSSYSKHAYLFIDQRLLAPAWRWPAWLCKTSPPPRLVAGSHLQQYIVSYHALLFELLLIDMYQNCTRTGFQLRACTASSPQVRKKYSFHKLIRVIRIFMRNFFVVHCHPRNICNIELFPNYGMLTQWATHLAIFQLQSCMAILLFLCKEGDNALHETTVWPRYTWAGEWLTEWLAVWA